MALKTTVHRLRSDDNQAELVITEKRVAENAHPVLFLGGGLTVGAYLLWLTQVEGISAADWFAENGIAGYFADVRGFGLSEKIPDYDLNKHGGLCTFSTFSNTGQDAKTIIEWVSRRHGGGRIDVVTMCNSLAFLCFAGREVQTAIRRLVVQSPSVPIIPGRYLGYVSPEPIRYGLSSVNNLVHRVANNGPYHLVYPSMEGDVRQHLKDAPYFHPEYDSYSHPEQITDLAKLAVTTRTFHYDPTILKAEEALVVWGTRDLEWPALMSEALSSCMHNVRKSSWDQVSGVGHFATFCTGRFRLLSRIRAFLTKE